MTVFCLHETATSGAVWRALAEALGDRLAVVAPDRFGWRDDTPEGYRATTIDEQAEDAAALLSGVAELHGQPVLCGAGLGAVVALDLLVGRPHLASAAILIEPPLLAFSAVATEALSADRVLLGEAVHSGGAAAGVELCLGGGLQALCPGIEQFPAALTAPARARPAALFAELGAVPGWSIPLPRLSANEIPTRVVVSASTPALVREASESLAGRLGSAELVELGGEGPAHLGAPAELAELALNLSA